MSSMNGSTSASTPACAYAARAASIQRSPAWWRTCGAAAATSAPSASGTDGIQALRALAAAEHQQPRSGPRRPAKRTCGAAARRRSRARTGLPITCARARRRAKLPGNASSTCRARCGEPAVGEAGDGVLLVDQRAGGAAATRPCRPARSRSRRAHHDARLSGAARRKRLQRQRVARRSGAASQATSALAAQPAHREPLDRECRSAGTRRDSRPRAVPSQTTRTPRSRSTRASASAGNTWPAGAAGHDERRAARSCGHVRATGARRHAHRRGARVIRLVVDPQQDAEPCERTMQAASGRSSCSGSVRPLVGSTPMLTPMLMKACMPIHRPKPARDRPGTSVPRATASRAI